MEILQYWTKPSTCPWDHVSLTGIPIPALFILKWALFLFAKFSWYPTVQMLNSAWSGIILCMCSANEKHCYTVTLYLIGWAHTQNEPCMMKWNGQKYHIALAVICLIMLLKYSSSHRGPCIWAAAMIQAISSQWIINIFITQIARFTGPTWGPSGADRTQVGPRLVPWTLLSRNYNKNILTFGYQSLKYPQEF